jgi:hypothetical protein
MPTWRARLEEMGFGLTELVALLDRKPTREPRIEREELFAELLAPTGLTAPRSTFTRRDLLQVLAERSDPSERVTVGGLQLLADAFLASGDVVRVTEVGRPGTPSANSSRRNGTSSTWGLGPLLTRSRKCPSPRSTRHSTGDRDYRASNARWCSA